MAGINATLLFFERPSANREIASIDGNDLMHYIESIPVESWKVGLKNYFNMLGLSSYMDEGGYGAANEGLSNYNEKLLDRNSCFKKLAGSFYETVMFHDSKKALQDVKLISIPLSVNVQNTNYKQPGWLWNSAMSVANNDPNLAMSLIGLCGHDDTFQISGSSFDSGAAVITNFESSNSEKIYKERMQSFYNRINIGGEDDDFRNEVLASNSIICPPSLSGMYIQGALGKETQLPPRLIQNISKIQAPEKGADSLPAKYYHTIGAAYLACSLVADGVPGPLIRAVTAAAINNYRTQRLCDLNSDEDYSSTIKKWGVSNLADQILKDPDGKSSCNSNSSVITLNKNIHSEDSDPECVKLNGISHLLFEEGMTKDLLEKRLHKYLDTKNADELLTRSVTKDDICSRPMAIKGAAQARLSHASMSLVQNCGQLSPEECRRAKQVLKTYLIDFEWSEKQHLLGADFAIKNCKNKPNYHSKELEKSACNALKAQGLSSPSQEGQNTQPKEAKGIL